MRHGIAVFATFLFGCATTHTGGSDERVELTGATARRTPPDVAAVLASSDRAPADRARDGARQAADVLAYLGVSHGMGVAVLASGSGYFTELLARSVGPTGLMFAENPPTLLARAGLSDAWTERLSHPAGARVVKLDTELRTPLDVRGLDVVFLDYDYDALAEQGVDPRAVDLSAWSALRSGGHYVIIDAAQGGHAREDIVASGFGFVSEGRFLRDGADPSDWNTPPRGERVLLTFARP